MAITRALLALSLLAGCGTIDGGALVGDTASDFTFTDANPSSPTFDEERSLHGRDADVMVLYFLLFG